MTLSEIKPESVLYLDIETVPQHAGYAELDEPMRELWDHKAASLIRNADEETPESLYPRAGIYAEFGRIVCISAGMVVPKEGRRTFRVKSFAGHDERQLLLDFALMLNQFGQRSGAILCGHNAKEFDIPYIARRTLLNGLQLPPLLDIAGRKPWEVRLLDTMELWKFGDYKHYTSLRLLTHIFGIPSPKDDIDGSQVADCYYRDGDIERIAVYCEKDVLAVAQLLLRYKGLPLINPADVERA